MTPLWGDRRDCVLNRALLTHTLAQPPSFSHYSDARSPALKDTFKEKWADILHVLTTFSKERTQDARSHWLRLLRENRKRDFKEKVETGHLQEDPSTIAAEFGMYFFEGM